jgi:uncharacterized repeat protein (TIGR03803 family)
LLPATLTTLVSFNNLTGVPYNAALIADVAGNLFGTTYDSGTGGVGSVFEIAKTATGYASTPTTLVSFNGTNGFHPAAGQIVADAAGNLFGTTSYGGGATDQGNVFEIKKTSTGYASTPTILANFDQTKGYAPLGGLIADTEGDLFGTTAWGGGANGQLGKCNLFEIAKTSTGYASTPTTLVSFNTFGSTPSATLVVDANGNLFGTTTGDGQNSNGSVFEIAKTKSGYASTPTILFSFGSNYGFGPLAGLITDSAGDLFGTTSGGGAYGYGTVFEIAKTSGGYATTPTVLVSFNMADGYFPDGDLIADAAGNLFGTTWRGGADGMGTVFKIAKTSAGYAGTPTTLVSFDGANGSYSNTGLLADAVGDLFGITYNGTNDNGTAFEVTNTGFVVPGGQASTVTSIPTLITGGAGNNVINATSSELLNLPDSFSGSGNETLNLVGTGIFDLRAPALLPTFQTVTATEGSAATATTVYMRDGYSTTLNLAPAPSGNGTAIIYGGTGNDVFNLATGSDTVVLGSAGESVYAGGGTVLVQADIAFAGAVVAGGATGTTTLELTTGGTATLAAADSHLMVKLDAATHLSLGTAGFITAIGSGGADIITAGASGQTLTGGSGADTLIGFAGFGDTFRDTSGGMLGDTISNYGGNDIIDITDLTFGLLKALKLAVSGSGSSVVSTLTATDGTHTAAMTLLGAYTLANFATASDGHVGTQIGFVHS